jgi:CRP-like cAMP-binding protein
MAGEDTGSNALRQISIFSGLPDEQLARLAQSTHRQRFTRGEIVCNRGDPGDRAYVILTGAVDLVIDSPDGRELILTRLHTGEHFGEMALLDDHKRSATARATESTELLILPRSAFFDTLESQPDMSRHIIRALVQRLRLADEKLEAFAYLDVAGRIARALLDLRGNRTGAIHVNHEEIGHMAAASRQTTTRVLGEWEDAGYVRRSRSSLTVVDMDALVTLAQL